MSLSAKDLGKRRMQRLEAEAMGALQEAETEEEVRSEAGRRSFLNRSTSRFEFKSGFEPPALGTVE